MESLDDLVEDFAHLIFRATHQDRVLERILGQLANFVDVLVNFRSKIFYLENIL